MQKLVRQIKRELKTAKHYTIYEEELSRVWPHNGKRRELLIEQFARDNGSRLGFYRDGLCAMFDSKEREGLRFRPTFEAAPSCSQRIS